MTGEAKFKLHEVRSAERRDKGTVVARIDDRDLHVTYTVHSTAADYWIDKVYRETNRGFAVTDSGIKWLDDLIHSSRSEGYGSLPQALSSIAEDLESVRRQAMNPSDEACCDEAYVDAHGNIGHQPWCVNK